MRRVLASIVLGLGFLALAQASAAATGPLGEDAAAVEEARGWLLGQQGEAGCIEDDRGEPSHRRTVWSTVAVAAAGGDPGRGDPSLVDGLRESCPPSSAETRNELNLYNRHVLALTAAGEDPRSFGGEDWIAEIRSYYAGGQFVSPDHPDALNDDMFAVLALTSAGVPASDDHVRGAGQTLLDAQNDDGGWGLTATSHSQTDYTGAALEALTAASLVEPDGTATEYALAYLQTRVDDETGCFSMQEGTSPNIHSTAWALRGLLTVHEDPRSQAWGTKSPWSCLLDHRTDSGAFAGQNEASAWATWEALPALVGIPHGRVTDVPAPSAELGTASTPRVDEATTLEADGAAFAGWQLPDGSLLEGARARWTPEEAGRVEMDVLLFSEEGRASSRTFSTTVEEEAERPSSSSDHGDDEDQNDSEPEAQAPEASLQAPADAERNVTFTVQAEAEPGEHPVTAFRLQVGGREPTDWRPTGTFELALPTLGEHTLQAWARDAEGHVSPAAEARIHVRDASPRVAIDGPDIVNRTEPVAFRAVVEDPDGRVANLTWTGPGDQAAEGPNATFAFASPGPNDVHLEATDEVGNSANATWTVHARNRAPTNLTVEPGQLAANASEIVRADAYDPDGDPLEVAWRSPGEDEPRSWGRQLHLETGPPGEHVWLVNVSDPYGGWTSAHVELPVREQPDGDDASPLSNVTVQAHEPPAQPPSPSPADPAQVELPATIAAEAGESRLLHLAASSPNGPVVNVTVAMGGPVPVRGTANATALLPALPAGEYELAARAADRAGWGPWTNATLVVEPTSDDTALDASGETTERSTPLGALAALAALAVAARRGRP